MKSDKVKSMHRSFQPENPSLPILRLPKKLARSPNTYWNPVRQFVNNDLPLTLESLTFFLKHIGACSKPRSLLKKQKCLVNLRIHLHQDVKDSNPPNSRSLLKMNNSPSKLPLYIEVLERMRQRSKEQEKNDLLSDHPPSSSAKEDILTPLRVLSDREIGRPRKYLSRPSSLFPLDHEPIITRSNSLSPSLIGGTHRRNSMKMTRGSSIRSLPIYKSPLEVLDDPVPPPQPPSPPPLHLNAILQQRQVMHAYSEVLRSLALQVQEPTEEKFQIIYQKTALFLQTLVDTLISATQGTRKDVPSTEPFKDEDSRKRFIKEVEESSHHLESYLKGIRRLISIWEDALATSTLE